MPALQNILFVFIDGVGIGPATAHNPLASGQLPAFEALAGEQAWTTDAKPVDRPQSLFRTIDARLGVEGLPQSGTGQATLFTGVNCARIAGRHFGPYPHSATRSAIATQNVFTRLGAHTGAKSQPAAFANAYPPVFFEAARGRKRWTVTTLTCTEAGVPIRGLAELRAGRAVTADLTGSAWREQLGLDVEHISEVQAARRLHEVARRHRLTLFEYYLTDKAGHGRIGGADSVLQALDRLFAALTERLDPAADLLLISSDHGNLEDLSTKSHTLNPVPLVAYGCGARHFRDVGDLSEVTPAIVEALTGS